MTTTAKQPSDALELCPFCGVRVTPNPMDASLVFHPLLTGCELGRYAVNFSIDWWNTRADLVRPPVDELSLLVALRARLNELTLDAGYSGHYQNGFEMFRTQALAVADSHMAAKWSPRPPSQEQGSGVKGDAATSEFDAMKEQKSQIVESDYAEGIHAGLALAEDAILEFKETLPLGTLDDLLAKVATVNPAQRAKSSEASSNPGRDQDSPASQNGLVVRCDTCECVTWGDVGDKCLSPNTSCTGTMAALLFQRDTHPEPSTNIERVAEDEIVLTMDRTTAITISCALKCFSDDLYSGDPAGRIQRGNADYIREHIDAALEQGSKIEVDKAT